MERKIYVVGGDVGYANWCEGKLVRSAEEADLVIFTGGEDVHPSFYLSTAVHPNTETNIHRDYMEEQMFIRCQSLGKKMLGICRGAQFLCAMAGGKLVQHQNNPQYLHPINLSRGGKTIVTSSHHQAMYPWGLPTDEYKVIGWTQNLSAMHEDGNRREMVNKLVPDDKECEIVWFKKNPSLNIQGHPEWMDFDKHPDSIAYFRDILNKFLNDEEID